MTSEFFGPLPPSDFNQDGMVRWLDQQVVSFQKIITGSLQADNELSSSNYVAGTSGWMIDGDGNVFVAGDGKIEVVGTSDRSLALTTVSGIPTLMFSPVDSPSSAATISSSDEGVLLVLGGRTTFATDKMGFVELRDDTLNVGFYAANSSLGVTYFQVTDADVLFGVPLRLVDGSVSAPALAFSTNPDLGLYTTGSDIRLALNGVNDFIFANSVLTLRDGASNPGIAWRDSTLSTSRRYDLYRDDANFDALTLIATNAAGDTTYTHLTMTDGVTNSPSIRDDTTGSAASVFIHATSGRLQRSTSALKYKTDTSDADLADIELRPMKFYREDDGRYFYGFIADWLGEQDPLLGEYIDGEIENYDQRAVLAVLAAKVNRLEQRLAA